MLLTIETDGRSLHEIKREAADQAIELIIRKHREQGGNDMRRLMIAVARELRCGQSTIYRYLSERGMMKQPDDDSESAMLLAEHTQAHNASVANY